MILLWMIGSEGCYSILLRLFQLQASESLVILSPKLHTEPCYYYGSFHVKLIHEVDNCHRFYQNLVSTYLTISDELAWNFSPWTCMVSWLHAFKLSKFGRIMLICIDHNSDTFQCWEVGQQFSESMWNVLFSDMLNWT